MKDRLKVINRVVAISILGNCEVFPTIHRNIPWNERGSLLACNAKWTSFHFLSNSSWSRGSKIGKSLLKYLFPGIHSILCLEDYGWRKLIINRCQRGEILLIIYFLFQHREGVMNGSGWFLSEWEKELNREFNSLNATRGRRKVFIQ